MCSIFRGSTYLSMPIKDRGFNELIINSGKATYLDSSTSSVFIHYYETFKDEGRFALAGLQGSPEEVFDMAKLQYVFQIFPDAPKAME
jgi:anti-anti-sigma regulatory factor